LIHGHEVRVARCAEYSSLCLDLSTAPGGEGGVGMAYTLDET
jgi:hypothetical protein